MFQLVGPDAVVISLAWPVMQAAAKARLRVKMRVQGLPDEALRIPTVPAPPRPGVPLRSLAYTGRAAGASAIYLLTSKIMNESGLGAGRPGPEGAENSEAGRKST